VTSEKSFLSLRNWITSIKEFSNIATPKIAIIGNKIDLMENFPFQIVETKDAEALAKVKNSLLTFLN
jgi:hypothetical protein